MIVSLISVNYFPLIAMQDNNQDLKIEEMLFKARYMKSALPNLGNAHNRQIQNDYFQNNDCQETLVSQVAQYIEENSKNGGYAFSNATINLLTLAPEDRLIQAYKTASKNIEKQNS